MELEKNIPEGWVETSIGELAELLTDYVANGSFASLKENVTYLRGGEGYARLIRLADHNKNYKGEAVFVNEHSYMFLKKSKLYPGDLIISNVGEYSGTLFRAPNLDIPMTLGPNSILMKFGESDDYMFYFLQGRVGKHLINTVKSGSANPKFNKTEFKKIEFIIPPISEQKAIAKVLTAFDDKIELLQAQNKTLETMAQTIFKEWFGKYQIGDELPEGWRVGEFGEVIEFINGYAFKSKDLSKEPIDNAYKVFKMGDINKGGGFKPGKTKGYYPKSMSTKLNKYILKNGDLLMSMTDMKDAISLLGHTALMIYEDEYIVNQRVGLIRAQNDLNIQYPYLYLLTNNDDFIAGIRAAANSGVQVNLSTQGIKETEFIIADKETNKAFNNVVMPLFEKRKANSQMIKELKKTRDTLLPKLMSGQVRVNNIKQTANA